MSHGYVTGVALIGFCTCLIGTATGQAVDATGDDLSSLDIEDLARIKVTSVTRRPEAVSQASAAVAVISREDIRRSGAANLPEALRLLPGLAVARVGTRDWAVSSRGFNTQSSNKMLVLIDGRVVYSPIFAGVFWDVQQVPLEDIDRVELIRGPGAALWGANAVNGVINVVTRTAAESQGGIASLTGGTNDQIQGELRYGSTWSGSALRVYGMGSTVGGSDLASGTPDIDDWQTGQGGFRLDLTRRADQTFTVQGDVYAAGGGQRLQLPTPAAPFTQLYTEDLTAEGGNLRGRWSRRISSRSDIAVQAYADYAARTQPSYFGKLGVTTFDVDFQHHFPIGDRQDLVWGASYRLISDEATGAFTAGFEPAERTVNLITAFVQDEIILLSNRISVSLGSRFEHNDFTGFELQPTGRILWTPTLSTSVWAAASRAVRTPSRVDSDVRIVAQVFDAPPVTRVELRGSEALGIEELVAYEAGFRLVPHERLSLDLTAFYHQYHRLRSFVPGAPESADGVTIVPFFVSNDARARVVGGTASATLRVSPWWRMRASYTYLDQEARLEDDAPAGAIPDANPGLNPAHQAGLWTSFDLPQNLELDVIGRYVSRLDVEPEVDGYLQADVQLESRIGPSLRIALIGRDLFSPRHVEFPQSGFVPARRAIERQVRARAVWAF